ncbi:hypothetical protein [Candidatus Tisiphia endosymbiont of Parasteatoda lunata]|uniref:hypothetical protein n=1 Tax=Candidatus Tisiphia endosymbiont of Parasteatoda lunata TaxID=3066275 RepID=UPI00313F10F1
MQIIGGKLMSTRTLRITTNKKAGEKDRNRTPDLVIGNDEVGGSTPPSGTTYLKAFSLYCNNLLFYEKFLCCIYAVKIVV